MPYPLNPFHKRLCCWYSQSERNDRNKNPLVESQPIALSLSVPFQLLVGELGFLAFQSENFQVRDHLGNLTLLARHWMPGVDWLYAGVLISPKGNKLQRPNSGFIQHTPDKAQLTSIDLAEIRRSSKISSWILSIISGVVTVLGRPGRGASQVEKSPRLNWATQFLTVAYDGACSPNVSFRMASISFGALPFPRKT